MTKFIHQIATIIERAREGKRGKCKHYEAILNDDKVIELWHYRTCILMAYAKDGGIRHMDGWSKSDCDAIGTALCVLGNEGVITGSKRSALQLLKSDIHFEMYEIDGWYTSSRIAPMTNHKLVTLYDK
jgi:hypothetical protein